MDIVQPRWSTGGGPVKPTTRWSWGGLPGGQQLGEGPHVLEHHRAIEGQCGRSGDAAGKGKDNHPGGEPGSHSRDAVLDDRATTGWDVHLIGGVQEDVESRLAPFHLVVAVNAAGEAIEEPGDPPVNFIRSWLPLDATQVEAVI
jgi:hypothetical protein